jgi:hypothetical protein
MPPLVSPDNRPKVRLTSTTTQQNEEKESMIVIYNLIVVVLEIFGIFRARWGNCKSFGVHRLGGCRVIPSF